MSVRVCSDEDLDLVRKADMLLLLVYNGPYRELVAQQESNDAEIEELRDLRGEIVLRLVKHVVDPDEDYVYICVEFFSIDLYSALRAARHMHDLRDIFLYYVLKVDPQENIDLSLVA